MRRLFEWGVVTEPSGRLAPVGITDEETSATGRMLEALTLLPDGIQAHGWVSPVAYRPAWNSYDRLGTTVIAVREEDGGVRHVREDSADLPEDCLPSFLVPHPARIYDFLLGGKENYAADRAAAEDLLAALPAAKTLARANRWFTLRAVQYLAEQGIRQFLDLGTGLPTAPNVAQAAREVRPDARVVYVDNDPAVIAYHRALLACETGVAAIRADIREPEAVLSHPELLDVLDFSEPVAVLLTAVLHFITEAEDPARIVAAFGDRMAAGSYLVISHGVTDATDAQTVQQITSAYTATSTGVTPRAAGQVAAWFAGFDLTSPALTDVTRWPLPVKEAGQILVAAGVGRRRDTWP